MNELENLKVGDKVIVEGAYINSRIRTVEKVTKRFIFVGGAKYSRIFGWEIGISGYSSNHIRPATDEDIERINKDREKRELIKHLNGVVCYNLPLKSLTHIWDVVKKEIGDIAAKQ